MVVSGDVALSGTGPAAFGIDDKPDGASLKKEMAKR
jgi:hypothetical protein